MKTYYSIFKRISLYGVLGLFGVAATSCSSYQNTSNHNDGIYGSAQRDANGQPVYQYNDGNVGQYRDGDVNGQNMNYQAYFKSLQSQYPATVDVQEYANDTVVSVESYNANAGWGEDPDNVVVNVYDNSWGGMYGWGSGWGWGGYPGWGWNSWYGGGWGLGWGWGGGWYGGWGSYYGGWGWNNWYGGWGNGYYPYYYNNGGYYNGRYNNYNGRRSVAAYGGTRSDYYNRSNRASRSYSNGRNTTFTSNRRFNNNGNAVRTRGDVQYNNSRSNNSNTVRGYQNSTRSNNTFTPSRSNNNYSPTRSNAPVRSTPTYSAPSRSSGGFGGGRSGGGGGGSRGGGGGGRRG